MKKNKIILLVLCALCLIVYFNSLGNGFVLDDKYLIINNPFIKSVKFIFAIFKNSLYSYSSLIARPIDLMYRPLQSLSYSFDYMIWRLNPFGFHLTNVLIHLLNSILVYYLLNMAFGSTLSRFAAILFLVHPVHTSVVSYISGRADELALLFMLLSIIFLLRFIKLNSGICYAISLVCAEFALLSRENSALLFLFIALILFLTKTKPKYYFYILSFIALDLLNLFLRFSAIGQNAFIPHTALLPLGLRIINFLNIIPRYLLLSIFPLNLHLFRTTPYIKGLYDARILLSAAFFLFSISILIKYRKNRLIIFSFLWFMIGIIPVLFFMDSYDNLDEAMMSESWLYISSVGFCVAFAYALLSLKKIGRVLIYCFIALFGFLTAVNNSYWKNDIILHKNILDYGSQRNYLRINLAIAYMKNNRLEDAYKEIRKFSAYYPDNPYVYYLWGHYYFSSGEWQKAIENYNTALSKEKRFFEAYYFQSLCYGQLKQWDKALTQALKCFEVNRYYVPNLIQLGDLYNEKHLSGESIKYYNMALEIDPNNREIRDRIKNAK